METLSGVIVEPEERRRAYWFWRYLAGSTVSQVGDAVTLVALPLLAVLRLDATSFEVSLITAATYVAWIAVGLPAGVLVQRLPLRGTQVAMDLVRGLAVLSVPAAALAGVLALPQVIGVALVVGLATVVFDVGNATLLPSIVDAERLAARNSVVSGTGSVVQLGGPALGGGLVQAFGAPASLLVDAVSYLVSAVVLRSLPRPAPPPGTERASVTALIRVGWRFVFGHEVLRPCVVAATTVNLVCGGLLALTPVFLVRTLGASPGLVGLAVASEGLGGVAGASLVGRLAARVGTARAFRLAALFGACAGLAMPLAAGRLGVLVFALGNAGFAAGVVSVSILARTHRQTATPRELLPRVAATVRFVSWGAIPLGAVDAGLAASALGNRAALWLVAAVALSNPIVLELGPLRRRRDL